MLGLTAQAWYDILYMILLAVAFRFSYRLLARTTAWHVDRENAMPVRKMDVYISSIALAALIVFFFN